MSQTSRSNRLLRRLSQLHLLCRNLSQRLSPSRYGTMTAPHTSLHSAKSSTLGWLLRRMVSTRRNNWWTMSQGGTSQYAKSTSKSSKTAGHSFWALTSAKAAVNSKKRTETFVRLDKPSLIHVSEEPLRHCK